ncbi:hypothetical protein CDO73_08125 [Saccharibacillus sp. O23]|uniref:ATP-binding response regulator n=1 Tax=Saccharibacillus sp. O23 TaxID=2009338 RepID=UPI000B4E2BEE|nr:ATP-binding protein [Saccharibacillus sp. O23]OWR31096.1 hypothetical protein CDO73_08125 [Saccharibacillus sp. O23]
MLGGNRIFLRNFAEASAHVVNLLGRRLEADTVMVVSGEGPIGTVVEVFNRELPLAREGQEIPFGSEFFASLADARRDLPVVIPQTSKHSLTRAQYPAEGAEERSLIGFPLSYSDGRKFGGLIMLGAEGFFEKGDLELAASMVLFLSYAAESEGRQQEDRERIDRLNADKQNMEAAAEAYRGEAQAARQSTQQKADFLAFMTHEIRNSLNGSIAMSDLLASTELEPQQQEYLEMIRSSNQFLMTLANNILDYSKLEAGKQSLDVSLLDPASTIEDVASLMAPRAIEKRVELILDVEDRLPMFVQGDAGKLRQILLNLLGNAVKFTHQGEILVKVHQAPPESEGEIRLEVSVRDTGIGIAADKLAGLFQTYQQVHDSEGRSHYGGTGLGLAITRNLIELMGGRISVFSAPGVGTDFQVSLPFAPYAEFDSTTMAPLKLNDLRVLVVDDNPTALAVLERLLSAWEACPSGASTAEEARSLLDRETFDLVLLDMHFLDLAETISDSTGAPPIALLAPLGTAPQLSNMSDVRFTVFKPLRRLQLYSALSAIKS